MTSAVLTRMQLAADQTKLADTPVIKIVSNTEPLQAAIPERGWPWWRPPGDPPG